MNVHVSRAPMQLELEVVVLQVAQAVGHFLSPLEMGCDQKSRPLRVRVTVPGTVLKSGSITSSGPIEQVRNFDPARLR